MIEFIKMIAREGGDLAMAERRRLTAADVVAKGNDKDLVTRVDRQVEEYLTGMIREHYPDHDIYGEETGRSDTGSRYCWVIDPIDGTVSFIHDQPFYSVSIGLQLDGETVAGVVYAPVLGELYHAVKGKGAFCNDRPIQVSSRSKLNEAVVSTGFSCLRSGWKRNNLPYFCAIAPQVRGVRRFGSAAMDLAYVASGREDVYWELNLHLYDFAAGVLLVKEAGGMVTDLRGGNELVRDGIVATNGQLHSAMLEIFRDYPGGE